MQHYIELKIPDPPELFYVILNHSALHSHLVSPFSLSFLSLCHLLFSFFLSCVVLKC